MLLEELSPFQNVIHDKPAIQIGRAKDHDHVAEAGYLYRTISAAELKDAIQHGVIRANPSGKSAGGRENVKHWDRGGGGRFFNKDTLLRGNQLLIRVAEKFVHPGEPVQIQYVELVDPTTWISKPVVQSSQ